MRASRLSFGSALLLLVAGPGLSGCAPSIASMDCASIVEHAKTISQGQPLKIQSVANAHEISRTETEARCQGTATMSDGSHGDLYLRAYQDNGNTMVAYQGTPFS